MGTDNDPVSGCPTRICVAPGPMVFLYPGRISYEPRQGAGAPVLAEPMGTGSISLIWVPDRHGHPPYQRIPRVGSGPAVGHPTHEAGGPALVLQSSNHARPRAYEPATPVGAGTRASRERHLPDIQSRRCHVMSRHNTRHSSSWTATTLSRRHWPQADIGCGTLRPMSRSYSS